jgi:hypothetical protein
MQKTLSQLSTDEFEQLVEHAIDKRLEVWFTQLSDALTGARDEDNAELSPEFAVSLRHALDQARAGEGVDLKTFREQMMK